MTRDRSVDAVRAVAVAGVVGGHWLVTGLVVDDAGAWRQASPLSAMPGFVPVSWVLQTLGLFFFAGGFAAARGARPARASTGTTPRRMLSRHAVVGRMRALLPVRLIRPVAVLLAFWAVVLGIGAVIGTPVDTLHTIAVLVISPLWFLLPYLVLRAVTPALLGPHPAVLLGPAILLVAASDAGLAPSWTAVGAAWSVPWVLGIAAARGRLDHGLVPALTGAAAMALLIGLAGYPAAAVGVPGDDRSNLSPPSLVAVALAVAQIGVFLMVRRLVRTRAATRLGRAATPSARLGRVVTVAGPDGSRAPVASTAGPEHVITAVRLGAAFTLRNRTVRPVAAEERPRGVVAAVNRAALPIYLAHQSVLAGIVIIASLADRRMPGLLTAPQDAGWVAQRLLWLPVLATALATVVTLAGLNRPQPAG